MSFVTEFNQLPLAILTRHTERATRHLESDLLAATE